MTDNSSHFHPQLEETMKSIQRSQRKSVVRTDRPAMTIAVDLGRKATKQKRTNPHNVLGFLLVKHVSPPLPRSARIADCVSLHGDLDLHIGLRVQ